MRGARLRRALSELRRRAGRAPAAVGRPAREVSGLDRADTQAAQGLRVSESGQAGGFRDSGPLKGGYRKLKQKLGSNTEPREDRRCNESTRTPSENVKLSCPPSGRSARRRSRGRPGCI